MADFDRRAVERDILRLMSSNRALLEKVDVEHVNHYVGVGEYEMALESLCLDLMHKPEASLADLEELGALAKRVGLDRESVYDSEFWTNFTAALETRRRSTSVT